MVLIVKPRHRIQMLTSVISNQHFKSLVFFIYVLTVCRILVWYGV